jgi:DNA invertase Pin-like site-specific DNA recombinase
LRELMARQDAVILEPVIVDPDEKGWDPNRPGIAELIRRVEAERPDIVAVYAVSRFARDNWLQESIWRRLKAINPDIRFVSATEPHAEDDLVRGLLGVISQAERQRMGAFLSSAFRERARRGLPHGRTPYGYRKGGDGRLVVDDDAARDVRDIVEDIEAGRSLWWIARRLNAEHAGGRNWEPNIVRNTVRSPAIAGGVKCADVLTWGAHDAIIGRDRWERVNRILTERRPIRTKQAHSWLEGLIVCGCGAPMHLVWLRPRSGNAYGQFRCSASPTLEDFQRPKRYPVCEVRPRNIAQTKAERLTLVSVSAALSALVDPHVAYEYATALWRAQERAQGQTRAALERRIAGVERERDRLLILYRRATLDVDRWEAADAELAGRLAGLRAELAALPEPPSLAAITATHGALTALADALAVDPAQCRRVLVRLEATVQRTAEGVRVVWPEAVAALLSDVA